jgi:light-regulated signal transduction histidine kinase (bacteriophytochrome)
LAAEPVTTEPTITARELATPDLTGCDREPIHIPGAIQPHGLLLVADAATQQIVGGAGDLEERLDPHWLSGSLPLLLRQRLDAALAQAHSAPGVPVMLGAVPGRREAFDAMMHRSGDHLLVELEPRSGQSLPATAVLGRLDTLGTSFERAVDLKQLCERAASAFRDLTGFDRVMIYRFLDDAAGMVVAEDRDPSLGTFLNHHFPASDIPKQARELYIRNRVRVIPDVNYVPAPIRGPDVAADAIDLSDVALRSVSPIHVQYLKNMGVGASASVSIVKDGLLWGLVACHHNTPRSLGFEVRAACRALAGGLARQIRAREEAEIYRERIRLRAAEDQILSRFDASLPFGEALRRDGDEMRHAIGADGFAAVVDGQVFTAGHCPSSAEIQTLARWLNGRTNEPFATHTLSTRFPAAEAYRQVASGLLAVTVVADASALLLWFRAEAPQKIEWAGNPHKEAAGPDGTLTPRHSFASWTELLRGQSRRWTLGELEAAGRLRRALVELRQGRRLRELNRELSEAVEQKDALIAEKDHLIREVNHRVQNSLQLVQAFLGLQSRAEESDTVKAHLAEAQRRLSAVALVHRRLYQADQVDTVDLARYLEELVGEMRASMGDEWDGQITLDLSPVLISADRAVNIGLVLTELVINANKYAYGGGAGRIAIGLEQYRNQFRLIVADQGQGKTREHQGFGTRMMNAMVGRLGGTIERTDNAPGLRVIVSAPIDQE